LQFNNLVVAPGETFSFWDRLGPVTVQRGSAARGGWSGSTDARGPCGCQLAGKGEQ